MWIFTTIGMYDLVENRDRKGWMIIKARTEVDIWNLYNEHHAQFRMSALVSDPLWDYRHGIHIGRNTLAALVQKLVTAIDYTLFKSAVHANPTQAIKTRPYLEVWGIMQRLQDELELKTSGWSPARYQWHGMGRTVFDGSVEEIAAAYAAEDAAQQREFFPDYEPAGPAASLED